MKRWVVPAGITFSLLFAVIVAASAIRLMGDLDGPRGFVFFLLIMVAPLFVAAGVAVTVWRLMELFLPRIFAVPERLLFAFSAFLTTCGSGPLAISLAVMSVTHSEGSAGAAGMWAFMSIAASAAIVLFGTAVALTRFALHGRR